jgi:putative cardiolipin synthase
MFTTIRVYLKEQRATRRCARLAFGVALAVTISLTGCASPNPSSNPPSTAIALSVDSPLRRLSNESMGLHPDSGFRPLPFSQYSMDARLALARHATRTIDVQYYLLQNDPTGRTLLKALRDAAERGVRVRILVDDLYTADSDQVLVGLGAFPNIEIRIFNPFPAGRSFSATRWLFSITDFARVNHRMHNKLFLVDGSFAVMGGRNMADEYFFQSKAGNFIDFDLLIAGAAVQQLESLFDNYWNSPRVYALKALERFDSNQRAAQDGFDTLLATTSSPFTRLAEGAHDGLGYRPLSQDLDGGPLRLIFGHVEVFADDPEKVTGRSEADNDASTVTAHVIRALTEAQSDVLLVSPYFVPGRRGMEAIKQMRDRGVKVTLITNTLAANDEPFASVAYARYRVQLLQLGVDIYEISSAQLHLNRDVSEVLKSTVGRSHAKIVVIDAQTTFVGSMNMDLRSARENTEIGSLVRSPELAQVVLRLIQGVESAGTYHLRMKPGTSNIQWVAIADGQEVIYDDEPEVGLSTRLKAIFIAPFISEGLL